MPLRAGDDQPAGAVTSDPVGLGQAVEGQAQQVRAQARDVDVLGVVVEDFVVDLIGQDEEGVLAGHVHDLLQDLLGVHRAGRVIRVDHHDCLGALGDLGADVLDGGVPVVFLVAQVVHRLTAGQGRRRRPQRVVRGRDEDLVAVVEQGLHRHRDQLGHAVTQEDVLDVELREAGDDLVAGDDRATGGDDALGGGVTLRVWQSGDHVAHDHVRGLEAELGGVAGVQLEDPVAVGGHALGLRVDWAADLVENVGQLRGLVQVAQFAGA